MPERMSSFPMESEFTETKAFVRSFVKQIAVSPGRATIHYTIPTPEDNAIGGADIAEVALSRQVMSSVTVGGLRETVPEFSKSSRAYYAQQQATSSNTFHKATMRRRGFQSGVNVTRDNTGMVPVGGTRPGGHPSDGIGPTRMSSPSIRTA